MKAKDFDEQFDDGHDILEHLDLSKAKRPNLETRRVNVDFPGWVIDALDKEAKRLGVSRQALLKIWIAERIEKTA